MVTYDAPLSVNYLLIILFILAATTPPSTPGSTRVSAPLKFSRMISVTKMNMR